MSEIIPIEAIRPVTPDPALAPGASAPPPVASPSAVARFEAAMAADAPSAVAPIDPIPFADAASAAWRTAQIDNQTILHRIRDLSTAGVTHASSVELLQLQYDVANLAFQQEVVTKVADKTSSAIQTLIKNQ